VTPATQIGPVILSIVDMRVGRPTPSTFLDLEEGQAHCFAVASYDANDENSGLPSAIVFGGPREDSEEKREKDAGAEADEADRP
jgi:hypothetical protein